MSSRAAGVAAVLALAALLLTGSASGSSAPWTRDLALINRGIDRAAAGGRIDSTEGGGGGADRPPGAGRLARRRQRRRRRPPEAAQQPLSHPRGGRPPSGRFLEG